MTSIIMLFTTSFFTIAFFLIIEHKQDEWVNPLDQSNNLIIENEELTLKLQINNEQIQSQYDDLESKNYEISQLR